MRSKIPIPVFLYDQLQPHVLWDGYVFSLTRGEQPCTGNRVTEWLYRPMRNVGITDEERIERNIKFHSWRKFANTYWRGKGVPDAEIRAVTRHKTPAMTEHYTGFQLEDMRSVIAAQDAMAAQIEKQK